MAGRLGLLAALVLVWLIILLPLKAVMMLAGGSGAFGYQDVYGSVWDGRVYGMRIAGVPVREIEMSAEPLPLFVGQLAARWRVSDDSARGSGRVALGSEAIEIRDMSLLVSIDRLGLEGLPGLDRSQMIEIDVDSMSMRAGQCEQAQGRVRTAALQRFAASHGFEGPSLLGVLSCDDEAVLLSLDGAAADMELSGEVRFTGQDYAWDIELRTRRPELADVLALAGMTRNGDIWTYQGSERLVVE